MAGGQIGSDGGIQLEVRILGNDQPIRLVIDFRQQVQICTDVDRGYDEGGRPPAGLEPPGVHVGAGFDGAFVGHGKTRYKIKVFCSGPGAAGIVRTVIHRVVIFNNDAEVVLGVIGV